MKGLRGLFLIGLIAILIVAASGCDFGVRFGVDFYVNGTVYRTVTTDGKSMRMPPDPKKDGYEFKGWFLDEGEWLQSFTVQSILEQPLSEEVHLKVYARFALPGENNGDETPPQLAINGFAYQSGSFMLSVGNSVKTFDMNGLVQVDDGTTWVLSKSEGGGSPIVDNIAILEIGNNQFYVRVIDPLGTAKTFSVIIRRKPQYTVSFATDGGTTVASQTVEEGGLIDTVAVSEPTKAGHTFSGWNKALTDPITANTTINALWDAQTFTLTFDPNGGHVSPTIQTVTFGQPYTLPTPTKNGFGFVGWYVGNTKIGNGTYLDTIDRTLTAKWTAKPLSVSYVLNGGQNATGNPTVFTAESEDILLSPAIRTGATFAGWYLDMALTKPANDKVASGTTASITLYAKWSLIRYPITYNLNGGSNDPFSHKDFTVESNFEILKAYKTDHAFLGWYETPDFSGEKVTAVSPGRTQALTLYASFEYGSDGIQYELNADGFYDAVGNNSSAERLIVPAIHLGIPVVRLKYQWSLSPYTNTVEIENGVKEIVSAVFAYHESLKTVILPSSITYLDNSAFSRIPNLQTVYFNATNCADFDSYSAFAGSGYQVSGGIRFVIGNTVNRLPGYFFSNMTIFSEQSVTVRVDFESGSSDLTIGQYAFMGADFAVLPSLPIRLSVVERYAFYGMPYSELTLPVGLDEIGEAAFAGMNLTQIIVPKSVGFVDKLAFVSESIMVIHVEAAEILYWHANWAGNIPIVMDCDNNTVASDGYEYVEIQGIRYKLKEGLATFIKQGVSAAVIVIADSITHNGMAYPITAIEPNAFNGSLTVTEVKLPAYLTEIPANMFNGCAYLQKVTFGANVIKIGEGAFYGCARLEEIDGGVNVTEIGQSAFYNCSAVNGLSFPQVKDVSYAAFFRCYALTSVTLSSELKTIGEWAFYESGLKTFILSETVISIGSQAFRGTFVTSLTVPKDTILSAYAFAGSRLQTVTFLGTQNLPNSLFSQSALQSVVVPEGVTEMGDSVFYGCAQLVSVTLPSTLTAIPYRSFEDCYQLARIVIPDSVQSIGRSTFRGCQSLTEVIIGSGVTHIGEDAFLGCTALRSLIIPASVENLYYIFGDYYKTLNLTIYFERTGKGFYNNQQWQFPSSVKEVYACTLSEDKTYIVAFTMTNDFDDNYQPLNPPARADYIFSDWYRTPSFTGAAITDFSTVTDGTVLYAKWAVAD